jgi:isoleucyl-tRNA synthetase
MWSPVEKTALAEAEIEYEDIVSTQIDVAFEITYAPRCPELQGAYAVIWTTTPWTIPVNQAIAFSPSLGYSLINFEDRRLVIAPQLIPAFLSRAETQLGRKPDWSFSFLSDHPDDEWFDSNLLCDAVARHPMYKLGGFFAEPRPFLPGGFVTSEAGTGLVHMAPDHGEDDFELCLEHGITPKFVVDEAGFYRANWAWLGGQGSVINNKFNAPDGPICSDLRDADALLSANSDFKHSYPHSWRSKAKVIYRCTPQWFIAMDRPLPGLGQNLGPGAAFDSAFEPTLRTLALDAIYKTRFVPEKGRNRLSAMVSQRPDWVISRQRAWGVPIALFVDKRTGDLLVDREVNRRIIDKIRTEGVDAWDPANAAYFLNGANLPTEDQRSLEYLELARNPDDYEMVTDILDVWFDSGCTHVFVLESGHWPEERWPADIYVEGSDQHRGWFQSSLLESCGTRGRAPYDAVLTHGFTMDAKGMKMSKSLGNTISPLDLMKEYGADILRLWALSVDFTEDHRIGKEILAGVADQYRKLRNTFRYLLGALDGFTAEERLDDIAAYPELERYMLHLTAELDAKLRQAVNDFDFNTYTRLLADFANNDLSAFFFDIRKDVLYCEVNPETGFQTERRRAYRTVLDILFHALVRWLAPVLVFTTEEVWGTRYPDGGSVHLLEWPEVPHVDADEAKWNALRALRTSVTEAIEPMRREKVIGSSLEAEVTLPELPASAEELAELFIVSAVHQGKEFKVTETSNHKCGRCWRFMPEVKADGELDRRCEDVLNG